MNRNESMGCDLNGEYTWSVREWACGKSNSHMGNGIVSYGKQQSTRVIWKINKRYEHIINDMIP